MESLLIGAFATTALTNWWAIRRRLVSVENLAKPLVMVILAALVLAKTPTVPEARVWFLAAVIFSLIGDLFLLPRVDRFVPGLAAFLLAHLAYLGGLRFFRVDSQLVLVLGGMLAVLAYAIGRKIVDGAAARDAGLRMPVTVYTVAITSMAAVAVATRSNPAGLGALLFVTSDAMLGWARFVEDFPNRRLYVMVTYHLGQLLLVLSF